MYLSIDGSYCTSDCGDAEGVIADPDDAIYRCICSDGFVLHNSECVVDESYDK